jgi:hypothetical protein
MSLGFGSFPSLPSEWYGRLVGEGPRGGGKEEERS